ncbi:MAG: reductase [Lentilactobacillus hilgardii]|uniref:reductase n=2 Tax=Lentilactobacillus hilgardii TaxID=1588 RepID=UPI001CC1D028|nr:reductase [Lentilactobacillus hilgardii]MBZ2201337.1 reductase [Lentilactobacillus hilgardii]MBZ2202854.1 reductase [Lentilactobacillus hilgardii]
MLYQYRKDYQKITMGLFSLVSDLQNMDLVSQEMAWYADKSDRMIYLWKDRHNNWSGLVGIEVENDQLLIHRLILAPPSRNQENYSRLLDELQSLYPKEKIIGGFETKEICAKWEQSKDHERI